MKLKKVKIPRLKYTILTHEDKNNNNIQKDEEDKKPLLPSYFKTCEDSHGGDEATKSIISSPSTSEEGEEENGDDTTSEEGNKNNESIVKHEYISISSLRFGFYKMIDSLADIRAGEEVGTETLSIKKIAKRVLDRRPISECYVNFIKENIFVLLDDSGSMIWWSNLLNSIASLCIKRKDIKIFWTPNGYLPEDFPKNLNGQNIIYVGDFDGGDTVYYLQKETNANVIWICPESRYDDTLEHNWCNYSLDEIIKTGVQFFRTLTLADLLKAFRKIKRKW